MTEHVVTVRQEVQLALDVTVANYTERVKDLAAVAKDESLDAYYMAVLNDLTRVAEAYRKEGKVEPEGFKVGDYVRLTGDLWDEDPPHPKGTVVQIVRVENYANPDGTENAYAYFLDGEGSEWYVVAEGQPEFGSYGGELVEVDPEIRVGDTVRINKLAGECGLLDDHGNVVGAEFVVTDVVAQEFTHGQYGRKGQPDSGLVSNFYVQGDPAGRGIWEQYIEKVHK